MRSAGAVNRGCFDVILAHCGGLGGGRHGGRPWFGLSWMMMMTMMVSTALATTGSRLFVGVHPSEAVGCFLVALPCPRVQDFLKI